jgi:hypothetical protein
MDINNMRYKQRIEVALASLDAQKNRNYAKTARQWKLGRTALQWRFEGKTVSRAEANSEYRMLLTNAQEDALIARINCLTDRSTGTVRNMAEEIREREINKNWTSGFVHRHTYRQPLHDHSGMHIKMKT